MVKAVNITLSLSNVNQLKRNSTTNEEWIQIILLTRSGTFCHLLRILNLTRRIQITHGTVRKHINEFQMIYSLLPRKQQMNILQHSRFIYC